MEWSDCAECERTCANYDAFDTSCGESSAECSFPGCACPANTVKTDNGSCILPEHCPCYHNGRSYQNGDTWRFRCNQW